jgi:uncharacterized metal-binding protein
MALGAADEASLSQAIAAALDESKSSVLICAQGPEAEKVAEKAAKGLEGAKVVRLPTLGDPIAEANEALKQAGLRCGIELSLPAEGLRFQRIGDCSPKEATTLESAEDADMKTRAEEYAKRRLEVVQLPRDRSRIPPVEWAVVNGEGTQLGPQQLAELAGDQDMLARLAKDRQSATTRRKAQLWTGVGLAALAPIPLLFAEPGRPNTNQDLLWTAGFLLISGGAVGGTSVLVERATAERQRYPALYYKEERAEDRVNAVNKALYKQIGLGGAAAAAPAENGATEAKPAEASGTTPPAAADPTTPPAPVPPTETPATTPTPTEAVPASPAAATPTPSEAVPASPAPEGAGATPTAPTENPAPSPTSAPASPPAPASETPAPNPAETPPPSSPPASNPTGSPGEIR